MESETGSNHTRGALLYEGKARKIFEVKDHSHLIWQEFKDSFTAFNGKKKAVMEGKGEINRHIASLLFKKLMEQGIPSHWVADRGDTIMVTRKLNMIPLELVVRNILTGSTAKRLGIREGMKLASPLVEFYYKKDELGDPFISEDQVLILKTVKDPKDIKKLKDLGLKANTILVPLFKKVGIDLIDFKLEFGYDSRSQPLLADEISPDSCRLWDEKSGNKMDKDRFRQDLGKVMENYKEILNRLNGLSEND